MEFFEKTPAEHDAFDHLPGFPAHRYMLSICQHIKVANFCPRSNVRDEHVPHKANRSISLCIAEGELLDDHSGRRLAFLNNDDMGSWGLKCESCETQCS